MRMRRAQQFAIRHSRKAVMSSAKRVWPVTLARASTRRRGTPITTQVFGGVGFFFSVGDNRRFFDLGTRLLPSDLIHPRGKKTQV